MLIIFLVSAALMGCEKKAEVPAEEKALIPGLDKMKFQRIEKFISIVWNIPVNEIKYDEVDKTFLIKGNGISLKELEQVYDSANEYKLNHEK